MGRVRRANRRQVYLLPRSVEEWVGPGHPVRFVDDFVDVLVLEEVGIREPKGEVGRPPVAADLLLKVWLYGFTQRIRSPRRLEKACIDVMPFLWLAHPERPDHNTFWRFFRDNHKALPKVFKALVQAAAKAKLISFALHAIDGTKLQAASSTDTALHLKSLEEKLKHLDEVIAQFVAQVMDAGETDTSPGRQEMPVAMQNPAARREAIEKIVRTLQRRIEEREEEQDGREAPEPRAQQGELAARDEGAATPTTEKAAQSPEQSVAAEAVPMDAPASVSTIEPASAPRPSSDGAASQGTPAPSRTEASTHPLLREAEVLKKEIEEKIERLDTAKTNHLSEHEPDARMMKGRGMNALGYNAQIVVDHESDLIVTCNVVAEENDLKQLTPMLEQVREEHGRVADQSVLDGGYDSGAQLARAEEQQMPVLVRLREDSDAKGDFSKAHFRYDAAENVYVCPRGEKLIQIGTNRSKPTSEPDQIYRCGNKTCPVRAQCSKDSRGRKIRRPPHEEARDRQAEKQQDPRLAILLGLRKEIVEHIFGIVKTIDGFRRFTVRGLAKVNAQWALVCLGINLRKLHALATWQNGKLVPRAPKLAAAAS